MSDAFKKPVVNFSHASRGRSGSTVSSCRSSLISRSSYVSYDPQFDPSTKRQILWSCLAALGIGNMMILNVAVFFPTYVKKRNEAGRWDDDGLNTRQVSFIIAIF